MQQEFSYSKLQYLQMLCDLISSPRPPASLSFVLISLATLASSPFLNTISTFNYLRAFVYFLLCFGELNLGPHTWQVCALPLSCLPRPAQFTLFPRFPIDMKAFTHSILFVIFKDPMGSFKILNSRTKDCIYSPNYVWGKCIYCILLLLYYTQNIDSILLSSKPKEALRKKDVSLHISVQSPKVEGIHPFTYVHVSVSSMSFFSILLTNTLYTS